MTGQLLLIMGLLMLLPLEVQGRERTLHILYTGAINGEPVPCGCPSEAESGGLAKLSGYILRNKAALYPYILIDAGNFSEMDTVPGRLKAEAVMSVFSVMKYDAVAFMKNEESFSEEFFAGLIQRHEVPFVSGEYPCRRSVSVSRGPFEIHVSAVHDEHEEGKLNILLTDKYAADMNAPEGWDVIISSSGEVLHEPLNVNGAVFVSGYPGGKTLGILTLYSNREQEVKKFEHRFEKPGPEIQEDKPVRAILDVDDSGVPFRMKNHEGPPAGESKCGCRVTD